MKHSKQTRNIWNKSQENYLRKNFGVIPTIDISQILNLSEKAVNTKARRMKLVHSRWWTQQESDYLVENYDKLLNEEIGKHLDRTIEAVQRKATKMGLTRNNFFPPERYCADCGTKLGNKYLKAKHCFRCRGKHNSGSANPRWKGGVSVFYQMVQNKLWPVWKLPVLARDKYTCQKCGEYKHLEVHHIRSFVSIREEIMEKHPQLSLDVYEDRAMLVDLIIAEHQLEDGITFCYSCHKTYHAEKRDELQGTPYSEGNLQPSLSNVVSLVDRKVQRLTGEDTQTNKPDTSVPLAVSLTAR